MKVLLGILLLAISLPVFAQGQTLAQIQKHISDKATDASYTRKQLVDLNHDGQTDIIYNFMVGEP